MTILHAEIECSEIAIFEWLDIHVDEDEEPTDLDAEVDWFCEDFINTYIISNGTIGIKVKDEDINKLKSYMKHLTYLKRHKPNTYKKLEEGDSITRIRVRRLLKR